MTRQTLLHSVTSALTTHGFTYQNFMHANSSFDLIARKQNIVLILKILSNIDALRADHARDLQKLSHVFHAHSLVIGERSKVFDLEPTVLYDRYDLPVLSLEGFESLLGARLPVQRSFKGKNSVELDAQRLREKREAAALTLKELSEKAGVSLETLHRYEHGFPAQMNVAEKLEKILHAQLIRGINVFDTYFEKEKMENEPFSNSALEQLQDLGLKLSVFERAPVTAAGKEHPILISHVENPRNATKKALLLEKTQRIVKQPGMIIASSTQKIHAGNIPMIREDELSTFSTVEDILLELKKQRKNQKSHD